MIFVNQQCDVTHIACKQARTRTDTKLVSGLFKPNSLLGLEIHNPNEQPLL